MASSLPFAPHFHCATRRVCVSTPVMLVSLVLHGSLTVPAGGANWPMRQRDCANTGRADFHVPSNRKNQTFFDAIRWQKPPPGSPNEGRFSSSTMVFFDGVGPSGADIVVGGYHWPKGVQGMDRHTGKRFWAGNPDGGEAIGENTAAFSGDGTTLYVVNDSTNPEHPLMAFSAVSGPANYRHNGGDAEPWKLSQSSPKVGPDNRIYAHHWSDRPHSATDNSTLLAHAWSAQTDVGTCYNVPQIWQDTNRVMVVSGGRHGQVKAWDGSTGSELWSAALPQGTDADATIDPASGRVYLPAGSDSIWVAGLDKNGNPLWGTVSKPVFVWQTGVEDPQRAQSAGCLSHDGLTYYFQTVSPNGQGKLYAINTANGSLKWSFATGSRGWERTMSSPIVSTNGVIVVGNNEGGTYFALLDNGSSATQLDTLAVADSGEARNSATLSNDGLLYLSGRWPWTTGNGDNDVPTQQSAYLFTAFDLDAGVFGTVAPEITSPPASQMVDSGSSTILTVAASGTPELTFQWYLGPPGDISNPIHGSTASSFTTPGLTETTTYWVRVSNSAGSADSAAAVIQPTPVPEAQVDISAALVGGIATVVTSTLDIGSSANIFDGSTSTLARSAAVNPMVVTLQFHQPLQLSRSRIFFGSGPHSWRIETADTLSDLDGMTGSFRLALGWQTKVGDQWNERLIEAGPACRFVRLTLQRVTGDNFVHLQEWQLFSGTSVQPEITTQPQSVALMPGQTLAPEMLRVIASGTEPLTYRWSKYLSEQFWPGPDYSPLYPSQQQLELGVIDPSDEGIYRVEISNTLGHAQSQEVVVGVNAFSQSHQDPDVPDFWLQIELEPVGVGGGWRFEGESHWRISGEPVTGLTAGQRTLIYKPLPGLVRPPDEILVIESSPPGLLSRTYLAGNPAADTGSLTCRIEPAILADLSLPVEDRAQWRLAGEDETQWSESGTTRTSLPEGDYLIEFKSLTVREAPTPVRVKVGNGEACEATAVYPPPFAVASGTWNVLNFATIHTATEPVPYACVGRVSSDQSEGSGFLIAASVVLTDARLVFDEGTLSFSTRPQWTAERHRDIHDPVGVPVQNILLMSGYSAQRLAEGQPGALSPASANLGVAAIRLIHPSLRFTGYLASDEMPHAWLGATVAKRVVGYPSRLSSAWLRGRMFESMVSEVPLIPIAAGLYAANPFEGGLGISGAPLLVRHSDGRDYPAGVLIGGSTGATVRAIDSEVLRLVFLAAEAEVAADGAKTALAGGATMSSFLLGSSQDPAALQVVLAGIPAGTIAGWRIGSNGTLRLSGALVNGLAAGTKRILFPPIAGLAPPGRADPDVAGGGYLDLDLEAGRKYVIDAPYTKFEITPGSRLVTARESALFSLSIMNDINSVAWFRDGELIEGESSPMLMLFPVTSALAGSYTARIAYWGGEYWTQPATLTVLPAVQTILWTDPQASTLEALPIDLVATADSGLPVQFEVVSGPATLTGSRLNPSRPGTVVLLASQPGNTDFMAAVPVSRTIEFVVTTMTAWRFIQFGTETNTGQAADDADPDGDGTQNRAEFAAGTDPNNAADVFRVLSVAKIGDIFRVTVPAKTGRIYTLRRGPTPSGPWINISESGIIPDERVLTLEDPAPAGLKAFYQVMTSAQ